MKPKVLKLFLKMWKMKTNDYNLQKNIGEVVTNLETNIGFP